MTPARSRSLALAAPFALLALPACRGREQPPPSATPPPVAASSPPTATQVMPPPQRPFSDEVRLAIFQEALKAEARANQEAVTRNPDASGVAGGGNPEKMVRRIQKRERVSEALQQEYRAEIATRYGISEIELRAIVDEGRLKKWPAPPE